MEGRSDSGDPLFGVIEQRICRSVGGRDGFHGREIGKFEGLER